MLQLILAQENYEVVTAVRADEALILAAEQEFDLYVLDRDCPTRVDSIMPEAV